MGRLLYENSLSYQGYLIIPFVYGKANGHEIYSYKLLSAMGYASKFHKAENPAEIYGSSIDNIVKIAQEHINQWGESTGKEDYFQLRYIYRHNLIVVYQEAGKYFYDHYPPDSLNNVAAPKIFTSEFDCISWIKQGLDGLHVRRTWVMGNG
ncbi:hypothetical protein [Calothrix sp. 336/3]|uniref:hypothetical protein n=1 Tax=Calothrix sp. 336/3 TaxID=1337936 RepID=UPI0004E3D80A|nr:hypothetical protein [Calothrix sp. 336/3]AKG24437.1 hypothetical protein IJ00_04340 [Calothrix sp. 336/3]